MGGCSGSKSATKAAEPCSTLLTSGVGVKSATNANVVVVDVALAQGDSADVQLAAGVVGEAAAPPPTDNSNTAIDYEAVASPPADIAAIDYEGMFPSLDKELVRT